jgi:cytochrome c peroxidase
MSISISIFENLHIKNFLKKEVVMKKQLLVLFGLVFILGISARTFSQPTLSNLELLGKNIFFDKISSPDNMSCADCHAPNVGYTGPNPGINKHGAVYRGAVAQRFGNRKPPSAAYAGFAPIFHYDVAEEVWVGGTFWDGRATGETLGDPIAEQALGPFLNPVEQNNYDALAVLTQIDTSSYINLWQLAWGEPLTFSTPQEISDNYVRVGRAIAAYERSQEVNPFTSKFDYYLAGTVGLTSQEALGLQLFNTTGKCANCHPSTSPGPGVSPLFTDYTYDNLGVPKNPENPFYDMDNVYLPGGYPINPLGDAWVDYGLGGYLQSAGYSSDIYEPEMGKFKVPTLRNVDLRPGNGFTKAYTHNGYFKSLKDLVHFYNTRDVDPSWPDPEYPSTINTDELGNLGLTQAEENAIVAFMKTLSDGYNPIKSGSVEETVREMSMTIMNPLTYSTNLTFSLPSSSDVRIDLYSISGNRVATLVQGSYPAGIHQVLISPENLTSGVYIIQMRALGQEITKKATVVH